nr:SCO family protein [Neisseriaceae bacterium]
MNTFSILLLGSLLGLSSMASSAAPLPDDSSYHVGGQWRTQDNQVFQWSSLQGKKQVVAMVYTQCEHTCPIIVHGLKQVQKQLTPAERQNTGFVLVSFTPKTDTPKVLKAYGQGQGLDQSWTLLSGDDASVRALAMVMDVKYQVAKGGAVSHSNTVQILDQQGRVVKQEN